MLVGASYVITVRLGPVGALGRVRAAASATPAFLAHGPLAAVHAVADAIADDYLQATEEIGRDIDVLEEAVFSTRVTDDSEQIYALKRENLELRDRYQGLAWHVRHKGIKAHPFAAPTLAMMERTFPARLELAARRYLASAQPPGGAA